MAILPSNPPGNEIAPPSPPARFLNIDEEGYFLLDGLRVSDQATGHSWMSRIRMDNRGRPYLADDLRDVPLLPGETPGETPGRILIEAFDQPLVALDVEVVPQPNEAAPILRGRFPYGFETMIRSDSLRADEWDRFYARTAEGVPLVFSRTAQSRFFQGATEYDDDSITFGEDAAAVTIAMKPLFDELVEAEHPDWWNALYEKNDTRWDNGLAHPLLEEKIPHLKLTRCRVLVLGCGTGHDAAWWEKRGHIVTGVDFSSEAIAKAKELYGERETLRWVQADVFKLPQGSILSSSYDIIFEHTMFCAIPPSRREELIRVWYRLLSRRGRLIGFVPVMDKLLGPPFGTSEWEIRKRLLEAPQVRVATESRPKGPALRRARFLPLLWGREKKSIEKRLGQELYFVVEKADSLTE